VVLISIEASTSIRKKTNEISWENGRFVVSEFVKTCDELDLGHVVENGLVNLELFFENRFDVGQVKLQLELAIAVHKVFAF
jgi:hypothetical protein